MYDEISHFNGKPQPKVGRTPHIPSTTTISIVPNGSATLWVSMGFYGFVCLAQFLFVICQCLWQFRLEPDLSFEMGASDILIDWLRFPKVPRCAPRLKWFTQICWWIGGRSVPFNYPLHWGLDSDLFGIISKYSAGRNFTHSYALFSRYLPLFPFFLIPSDFAQAESRKAKCAFQNYFFCTPALANKLRENGNTRGHLAATLTLAEHTLQWNCNCLNF